MKSVLPFELENRVVQNFFVSPEALHQILQQEELFLVFHQFRQTEVDVFPVAQHFPVTRSEISHPRELCKDFYRNTNINNWLFNMQISELHH